MTDKEPDQETRYDGRVNLEYNREYNLVVNLMRANELHIWKISRRNVCFEEQCERHSMLK